MIANNCHYSLSKKRTKNYIYKVVMPIFTMRHLETSVRRKRLSHDATYGLLV